MSLAALDGCDLSGYDALPDHGSFELGDCAEYLKHEFPDWGGCVERLGKGAQPDTPCLEPLQDVQEVGETSGDAVNFPDDQDSPGGHVVKQCL